MAATITSLGVCVPRDAVTNDFWPASVVEARAKDTVARRSLRDKGPRPVTREEKIFDELMTPYLEDPFRGSIERRWLSDEFSVVDMEAKAIEQALSAAGLETSDVDLILSSAFPSEPKCQETFGVGHAAYIARKLRYSGAAWNVESACAITPIALQQACALVDSGHYENVVVIISCSYGRHSDRTSPISASVGDAATAYVVRNRPEAPRCECYTENTHESIGAIAFESVYGRDGRDTLNLVNRKGGARLIWKLCTQKLVRIVERLLAKSSFSKDDLDLCAFNTPLAWYAEFARRALELPAGSVADVHGKYANVGPCLPGLSLQESLERRANNGGNVLIHSIGSVSSAACILFPSADIKWTQTSYL